MPCLCPLVAALVSTPGTLHWLSGKARNVWVSRRSCATRAYPRAAGNSAISTPSYNMPQRACRRGARRRVSGAPSARPPLNRAVDIVYLRARHGQHNLRLHRALPLSSFYWTRSFEVIRAQEGCLRKYLEAASDCQSCLIADCYCAQWHPLSNAGCKPALPEKPTSPCISTCRYNHNVQF